MIKHIHAFLRQFLFYFFILRQFLSYSQLYISAKMCTVRHTPAHTTLRQLPVSSCARSRFAFVLSFFLFSCIFAYFSFLSVVSGFSIRHPPLLPASLEIGILPHTLSVVFCCFPTIFMLFILYIFFPASVHFAVRSLSFAYRAKYIYIRTYASFS